ncbi:MAG TPA: DUF4267 domain-containing protein [Minicystis sp.]|nr:DUF4267 domain-containing protein [Minicystis sp.]
MLQHVILGMGIGRIVLGLIPFFAARRVADLLGFPRAHDTASTRLMARFFGVRDVGLGVLVFYALAHPSILSFVLLFNALTDLGDLAAIAIPLLRRQGIDRAAWSSAGFAAPAAAAWLVVRAFSP